LRIDVTSTDSNRGVVVGRLRVESVQKSASLRGLSLREHLVEMTISALKVGRHPVVVGEPARADAFVEVLGDAATDCGICLGTLGLTGATAGLLSPSDVLMNGFRNDFWLILRRADAASLERLVQYLTIARPPRSWHFIGTSVMASGGLLRELSPAGKRRIAVIELD
jgi:hypothetical protein